MSVNTTKPKAEYLWGRNHLGLPIKKYYRSFQRQCHKVLEQLPVHHAVKKSEPSS